MLIATRLNGYDRCSRRLYFFDMGSDSPDTSGINAAALAQAQLSREQLDFVKSVYAGDAGNRDAASAAGRRASAQQETATGQQIALTDQYAQQHCQL